jgi:hypothetical protein
VWLDFSANNTFCTWLHIFATALALCCIHPLFSF